MVQRLVGICQISVIGLATILICYGLTYCFLDYYKGSDFTFSETVKEKDKLKEGGKTVYLITLDKNHKIIVGQKEFDSFKIDQPIKVHMRQGCWSGRVYIVDITPE